MLHGRWVRPGQGPWLTEGFAKPLSVDASSIAHLQGRQDRPRQGDFLGVVGPVEYQVVQAAAQLKVKWAESPILPGHANLWSELPQGGLRRADAGPDHDERRQLRHRVQGGGEDRVGARSCTRTPATRRSARRARSRDYKRARRPGQGHRRDLQQHAERRDHGDQHAGDARPQDPGAGAQHLLRGLELVRQRLPLPRHQRLGRDPVERRGRPGAPAADAVGRAGLEQVRPGDHARHACGHRRERQHRRVRGRRVRAGRRRQQRRQAAARRRPGRAGRRRDERREPRPDVQGRQRTRSGTRATA